MIIVVVQSPRASLHVAIAHGLWATWETRKTQVLQFVTTDCSLPAPLGGVGFEHHPNCRKATIIVSCKTSVPSLSLPTVRPPRRDLVDQTSIVMPRIITLDNYTNPQESTRTVHSPSECAISPDPKAQGASLVS